MNKFKRRLVFLLCVVGVSALCIFIYRLKIPDQKTQGSSRFDLLVKNSSEIHRIWFEGENSKEWIKYRSKCIKKWGLESNFDESLVRCNPILIDCLNQLGVFKEINFSDRDIEFVSNYTGAKAGAGVVGHLFKINDKLTHESLEFVLKDSCHENYLEKRIYAYGEMNKNSSDDYLFDTFDQDIYFDRHLVTVREFNEYKAFKKEKLLEINSSINFFTAVYDISFDEMKDYCNFRGKKMMEAQIFDAASFIPIDENEKGVKVVKRAPMYWSKSKSEKIKSCNEAYTLECLEEKKFQINGTEPTWAGLYDAQGGYLEALNNPIDQKKNLKMSSFYFKRDSKWQSLGQRSFWKGQGSDLTQFEIQEFELDPSINQLKVGFRCMRLVD